MYVALRVSLQIFQQRGCIGRCGAQVVVQGRVVEEQSYGVVLAVELAGHYLYIIQGRVDIAESLCIIDAFQVLADNGKVV